MPIPDYQSLMLPLLKYAGDKKEHSLRETIDFLANEFGLSDEERKELLPSGQQAVIDNRVGWARTYLKKAGLLESTRRAFFKITNRGLEVLKQDLGEINVQFLKQYPEFVEFQAVRRDIIEENAESQLQDRTPSELIEEGYQKIKDSLAKELLESVKNCSPQFFEKIVIELLLKMGYGGNIKDAGKAIGRSGDEGIDGIIKEDKLGLDVLYIQAKRWNGTIGRPEIHRFVGALQGQRARKGIFITTSTFSREAIDYVASVDLRIILIDGEQLS